MFIILIELVFLTFVLYSVTKIVRRKLAKPNYLNKVIWITGASSGIGEYLTYEFNRCGGEVIISARNEKQLERVKQACVDKSKVRVVKLDMSDYVAVEKVTKEIIEGLQRDGKKLDVVVENAGVGMRCEFKDYSFENHLSMFNVNVNGPYKHLQCILPHFIKNRSGQIVGITSVQGKLATAYRSSYAATKHAFIGVLDSLRSELYDHGIKVTNIMPGYVRTNVSRNAFGAEAGEKFGETDQNIEKGMSPQVFSNQAVKVIYRGENEAQISHQVEVTVGFFVRNLCPDLSFFGLRLNKKKQTKAVKKVK